jgi:hypothetical protein
MGKYHQRRVSKSRHRDLSSARRRPDDLKMDRLNETWKIPLNVSVATSRGCNTNIKRSSPDPSPKYFSHQRTLTKIKDRDTAARRQKTVKDRLNATTMFSKNSNLNDNNLVGREDLSLTPLKKKIGFGQIEKVGYFWGRNKSDFDINL